MGNITKAHIAILIMNIVYLLIFSVLFLGREKYEFLIYIGTIIFFIILISNLHLKYNFSTGILLGLSFWGLLHMSGGYFIVNEGVLYGYQIFSFLRFDQFVHMFGFGMATLFSYYVLKPNLKNKISWRAISVLVVFIGMGLGALNEIVEFIAVLTMPETGVGGYTNTLWDIVFNAIGAVIAVVYINVKRKIKNRKQRKSKIFEFPIF